MIFVFSHLHKAAGTTVNAILRRSFGTSHMDVETVEGFVYGPSDLEMDIARFGEPASIAGHGLRPFVDFGAREKNMFWYTVVRDPVSRCISHYQHQVEKMGSSRTLEDWLEIPRHRNLMVRFYGGTSTLEQAIGTLRDRRVRIIMLDEGLESGLRGVFGGSLEWAATRRNPTRTGETAARIKGDPGLLRLVERANELDLELFERMRSMDRPEPPEPPRGAAGIPALSSLACFLNRNLCYRPWKRRLRSRQGKRDRA